MYNINNEIVAKYFEMKGYLVHRDISEIDLAIHNPETGDKAIVDVKGWHAEVFYLSHFSSEILDFPNPKALKRAEEFFKDKNFRKILVVSKISKRQKEECLDAAKKTGIDEVIEFKSVLDFLITNADEHVDYKDMVQQMARLFKIYYPWGEDLKQRSMGEFL